VKRRLCKTSDKWSRDFNIWRIEKLLVFYSKNRVTFLNNEYFSLLLSSPVDIRYDRWGDGDNARDCFREFVSEWYREYDDDEEEKDVDGAGSIEWFVEEKDVLRRLLFMLLTHWSRRI